MSDSIANSIIKSMDLRRRLPPPEVRRALRIACGTTQDEIAQAMGCTRQAVALWEQGKRQPNGAHLATYVEILQALRAAA
jgi:DNA-binding transcriptional regulator YiaG